MAIEKSLVPHGFEEYLAVSIDKDSKVTRYIRYRPIGLKLTKQKRAYRKKVTSV